jgi:hypothetical protein
VTRSLLTAARSVLAPTLATATLAAAACGVPASTAQEDDASTATTTVAVTIGEPAPTTPVAAPSPSDRSPPVDEAPTTRATPGSTAPSEGDDGADSRITCGELDPATMGFDPFYARHCDALGVPVLASADVDPAALEATAELVVAMIGHRRDLIDTMVDGGLRIGVIGRDQVTSEMPEYRDLYEQFPGTDWDTRARGLGATPFIPLSTVGEENVLCLADDPYLGESILVHEFAHTVHVMGLDVVDPGFSVRLAALYDEAMSAGLWSGTYAATNPEEYLAEAVQSYFDTNQVGPPGGDGIHNDVDTRAELAAYDPAIHDLIAEVFAPDPLPLCRPG